MAAYSHLLSGAVKVQYRLGDIVLSASGTVVADSGRSIFLEQHVEQRGKRNYFRWEIPYPYIIRIEPLEPETQPAESQTSAGVTEPAAPKAAAAAANLGDSTSSRATIIPFPARHRTA